MSAGDFKWFAQGLHDLGNKIHDLDADDLRLGYITDAVTPAVNTTAPHWGGTGTTNFASNQVATGTAYTGPIALASESWVAGATGPVLDSADIAVAQDAAGFTNARWGIIYNNTDANKRALGFVDLGSNRSIVGGPLTLEINAAGMLALIQS